MNTKGYGGKPVTQAITVQTNDPLTPERTLTLRGKVDKIADISSRNIRLEGAPGEELSEIVTIKPSEKYNFKIISSSVSNGDNIDVELNTKLSEVDGSKKTIYELSIKNIKKTPGRYYESIHLKTDLKNTPDITIRVFGFIREPLDSQAAQ